MKYIHSITLTTTLLLLACKTAEVKTNTIQTIEPGKQIVKKASLHIEYNAEINFLLYLPSKYNNKNKWPLLLFLHGAGERGTNLDAVSVHGPPKMAKQGKLDDFIIVSPQCPKNDSWVSHKQQTALMALLEHIESSYKVDEERIYITGLSMGGFGSWALGSALNQKVAAVVPVCGGGSGSMAHRLTDMPVWAFHGAKDKVVPPELSIEMVDAINASGGNARLTLYPNANHNSWDKAYSTDSLYTWLLSHKRSQQ